MPRTIAIPGIISTQALALYCEVEERAVKRYIKQKKIPVAIIGKKWLIRVADIPFEELEPSEEGQ